MVNTLAIVSLAISILAVVLLPFGFVPYILAIIALVLTILCLFKIRKSPKLGGKSISIVALILSLIPILYFLIVFIWALQFFPPTNMAAEKIPAGQEIPEETTLYTCSSGSGMSCSYKSYADNVLKISIFNSYYDPTVFTDSNVKSIEINVEGCIASRSNPNVIEYTKEKVFTFTCEPKADQKPVRKSIKLSYLVDGERSDTEGYIII